MERGRGTGGRYGTGLRAPWSAHPAGPATAVESEERIPPTGGPPRPEDTFDLLKTTYHLASFSGMSSRSHDHALAGPEDAFHRLSTIAGWAVSACAVHCLLTPFAGVLPLIGLGVFAASWFEWAALGIGALLGGLGLGMSHADVHDDPWPSVTFAAGVALLAATHLFLEESEFLHASASVIGAAVILFAGARNHALVHACERCHPHPQGRVRRTRSRPGLSASHRNERRWLLLPPSSVDEIEGQELPVLQDDLVIETRDRTPPPLVIDPPDFPNRGDPFGPRSRSSFRSAPSAHPCPEPHLHRSSLRVRPYLDR